MYDIPTVSLTIRHFCFYVIIWKFFLKNRIKEIGKEFSNKLKYIICDEKFTYNLSKAYLNLRKVELSISC